MIRKLPGPGYVCNTKEWVIKVGDKQCIRTKYSSTDGYKRRVNGPQKVPASPPR